MEVLRHIIKRYWGFDAFLPLQQEAMACVMGGRDSLVVLPTGGGKSLCFQAPAMTMEGMAVVISPLLSLMKDQVDALKTAGVPAAKIDSAMTAVQRNAVHQEVQKRRLKLLYVSPERMVQPSFLAYLQESGIAFVVVDEAHCISHWGHDFRPEYRELCCLREAFPDKAIHAYTATATTQVRQDIVQQLGLRDPAVLTGSFDRPNLIYRVQRRSDDYQQIRGIIDEHPGDSGIIYCIRRSDVDALCDHLAADGYRAAPYHAGMSDLLRKRNQEAFSNEKVDIIAATVAFGMGIDKSNVRYIIHAAMPKSIEHYHQETGRAGRDGLPAECRLLYSYADFRLWQSMLEKNEPEGFEVAAAKLKEMLRYCERAVCRHKALVTYFGQIYPDKSCGACDICLGQIDAVANSDELARAILSCVADLGSFAGPTYTTLVLKGSREDRVLAKGHDRLATYGALVSFDTRAIRDWIEQLVQQGYLEKTGEYNILVLTPKGLDARKGGETPALTRPQEARPGKYSARKPLFPGTQDTRGVIDRNLFDALRRLRRATAEELEVPPFVIFSDATLRDMVRRQPTTLAELLNVSGVGQKKADAYGEAFLEKIREFRDAAPKQDGVDLPAPTASSPPAKRSLIKDHIQRRASALFAEGRSVEEVAEALGRKPSTVHGYLVQYLQDAHVIDPAPWAEPGVMQRIREAAAAGEGDRLKPIYERLNGEIGYETIRICMTCLRNAQQ